MTEYRVELTPLAIELLGEVRDRREQQLLKKKLRQLQQEPDKQGKALVGKLSGYRSVRAVGQRYRIVYKVVADKVLVLVVGIGRRKEGDRQDIYTLLEKFLS